MGGAMRCKSRDEVDGDKSSGEGGRGQWNETLGCRSGHISGIREWEQVDGLGQWDRVVEERQ